MNLAEAEQKEIRRAKYRAKVSTLTETQKVLQRELARQQYHENKAARRAYLTAWRAANPEKEKAYSARGVARIRNNQELRAKRNADTARRRALDPVRTKEVDARYRRANKDKTRFWQAKSRLKKLYGLSVDDKKQFWLLQGQACAICYLPATVSDSNIDHCHSTGVIRGLLCSNCNLGIGNLKDAPEVLRRAADYIERNTPQKHVTLP